MTSRRERPPSGRSNINLNSARGGDFAFPSARYGQVQLLFFPSHSQEFYLYFIFYYFHRIHLIYAQAINLIQQENRTHVQALLVHQHDLLVQNYQQMNYYVECVKPMIVLKMSA